MLNTKEVSDLSFSERARIRNQEIGFIFQAFNLIGDLTVYENVELPLTYRGMPSKERKERVQEALERVGMSHRMKHYPSQLSGGQQQRVAVARAVVGKPSILLADEPTGNLDSRNSESVMELLEELHQRRRDDLHGHPRPALRPLRRPLDPPLRRPRRRGGAGPAAADRAARARAEGLRRLAFRPCCQASLPWGSSRAAASPRQPSSFVSRPEVQQR